MRTNKLLIVAMLLIAVLMLAACGTTPTPATAEPDVVPTEEPTEEMVPTEEPTEEMAEEITLTVYVVDFVADKTDTWLMDEVVPAFQETHPNVKVEFVWGSWSSFDATVAGYFAAGDGPDIINLGSEYNGLFGDQLAPLNEYLGEEAWPEITQFVPGTLENTSWKGELRGLPIFTAPRFVFCRKDLMEAAGYTEQPKDFAEWVKFAEDLSEVDPGTNALTQQGFYPMDAGTMADFQWYLNTIWSLGGTLYKEDGVTPNFDSEEAAAALQFNYDIKRAVYADDTVSALPAPAAGTLLDEGGGAVCTWHSGWGAPALTNADTGEANPVWENIDIQSWPGDPTNFPNSQTISLAFVDWWAVPAYSPNVEMAAEFLKFVFSKDNNYTYNEGMGLIPARVDAQTGFVLESPVVKREAELAAQYSFGYAGILEPSKLRDILQKELGAYLTDQQDQATTLTNIQEQYTQVLTDGGFIK